MVYEPRAGYACEPATEKPPLGSAAIVPLVGGNHEGRSRAFAVLGETVEACERDGWLLVHGDRPARLGTRTIIGHLHPSLHMGGGATTPAFVASVHCCSSPLQLALSTATPVWM